MRPVIGLTISHVLPQGEERGARYVLNDPYVRALVSLGAAPVLVPGIGEPEIAEAIFPLLDGLLLTGGADIHPARYGQNIDPQCGQIDEQRDATELALVDLVKGSDLPTLGICRGVQLLNVGFGGSLVQDIPTQRPTLLNHRGSEPAYSEPAHMLSISAGSRLADMLGTTNIPANSMHHQAVSIASLPVLR